MTTTLSDHTAFTDTYSLLEELWAAGGDYGLSWPARSHLAQALAELTGDGSHTPDRPIPPSLEDAEHGFSLLDDLLAELLAATADLPSTLRLTRIRDHVAEARRLQ